MTNEEKAKELGEKYSTPCHGIGDCEFEAKQAAIEMARWKDEQLKEVCKICEQHIIDSGKAGCAFRSLSNEYCWED